MSNEPIMYREEMDEQIALGCPHPDCNCGDKPLSLIPSCHKKAGLDLSYYHGVAWLSCKVCGEHVGSLAIARKANGARRNGKK